MICKICDTEQPVRNFPKRKRTGDGRIISDSEKRMMICDDCIKAITSHDHDLINYSTGNRSKELFVGYNISTNDTLVD